MSDHPLSQISAVDAFPTLVSAYRNDPVHRWLYPDDESYPEKMSALMAAVGGTSFEMSTAWRLEDATAVALWVPPGVEPDAERIGTVLLETTPEENHPVVFGTLEQTDAFRPEYPHWYLPFFGVEQSRQGQGLGTSLLGASLEYVDLGGLPVYLLASNPRNIPFFERFGFAHAGEAREGSAPALAVMIRKGRNG